MTDFLTRARIRLYGRCIVLLSACAPLRDVCSLLYDGATVDTHNGNSIVFRTVIQVDGDVLTIVADSDGAEALWEAHGESVANMLARISDQLNGVVRWLTWCAGIGTFVVLALRYRPDASVSVWGFEDWFHLFTINILMPMGFGSLARMPVVRRAAGSLFLRNFRWVGPHDRRDRIEAVQAAGRG